ncbi:hypothetical protein LNY74_05735 [Klebsiella pneumoniae]|nr:hypothetical protein [Klebsiella pneumoniae]MTW92449.1 hypothetical protein [Klebsiella pneumoniae]
MKKINKLSCLFITSLLSTIALATYTGFRDEEQIECTADLLISRGDNSLNMKISQKLQGGKGIWIISGSVHQNDIKYFIGKTVEFDYLNKGELYKLTSTSIQNSPQFNIPKVLEEKWLTRFAMNKGEALTLRIEKFNKSSWIVYAQTIPLYLCEK